MKKSTLLKVATTFTVMLFVSGIFAQTITVKKADGTPAAGATIYTINSSTGANSGNLATGVADAGGVLTFVPVVGTNYIVNLGTEYNTYTPSAVAPITITLNAKFLNSFQDYRSGNDGDQVTLETTIPLWVYPSTIYNSAFNPANATLTTPLLLHNYIKSAADVSSIFTWSIPAAATLDLSAVTGKYAAVPVTAANGFAAGSSYTANVFETPAAPFAGCPGASQKFTFSVVAQPTMTITTPAADINACEGTGSLTTAISATLTGTGAASLNLQWDYIAYTAKSSWDGVTFPVGALNLDDADITAQAGYTATDYPLTTAPQTARIIGANELIASRTWNTYQNKITIYEFKLIGVNDKISRKSDYISVVEGSKTVGDPASYTYYTNGTTLIRRIVVKPTPSTGPIYHIPNSWGL